MVQDLLLLNPDMTEEMATKGADLDADGNLIAWIISTAALPAPPITALPECECH